MRHLYQYLSRRGALACIFVAAVLLLPARAAQGQDGTLDPAFGDGGIVQLGKVAWGVALQEDGRIIVAGNASGRMVLERYHPDGSLDVSFGADGQVVWEVGAALRVAVQEDGKIVALGRAFFGPDLVARFSTDGALDADFGDGGLSEEGVQTPYDMVLYPGGKIVVAGWDEEAGYTDFSVARYNEDGWLDDGFGNGGIVTTNFTYISDQANGVAVQADGKIVAVGAANHDFGLARYNVDGTLDEGFGDGGKVVTDFGYQHEQGADVIIQPDGKIVAVGDMYYQAVTFAVGVARYNPDGSLDAGFGNDGLVQTLIDGWVVAQAAALQEDGKIVVCGYGGTEEDDGTKIVVLRYLPDGTLDPTFGNGGVVLTDEAGGQGAHDIVIQPDGKVVVVGTRVLVRYIGQTELTDVTPPVITVEAEPMRVWPPDGGMQQVLLEDVVVSIVDDVDGELPVSTAVITEVTSDEPPSGNGKAGTADIVIGADCRSVSLAADREGGGNGRVYTIHLRAEDASGNVGTASYQVHVPHDQGKGKVVVDDGPSYAVSSTCAGTERLAAASQVRPVEVPTETMLAQNYPNPFRDGTAITFSLDEAAEVRLAIYDVTGREVARLVEGLRSAGTHTVRWEAEHVPSGLYVYRLTAGAYQAAGRMVVVK